MSNIFAEHVDFIFDAVIENVSGQIAMLKGMY